MMAFYSQLLLPSITDTTVPVTEPVDENDVSLSELLDSMTIVDASPDGQGKVAYSGELEME